MNVERELVLILTATLDIKGMPGVTRPRVEDRESDYIDVLRYYLAHHFKIRRIVFIENSGYSLDRLREAVRDNNPFRKEVEFVSMDCNDFPRELGKSYGEMRLLDQGIPMSVLAGQAQYYAKLTGRNILLNLTDIIEAHREPFHLLCDIRDHGIYEFLRMKSCGRHCDTRFLVFSADYFRRRIKGHYPVVDESRGMMIENYFYGLVKTAAREDRIIPRFSIEPKFRGMAGHRNKNYSGVKERAKRSLRATCRRLLPDLHI